MKLKFFIAALSLAVCSNFQTGVSLAQTDDITVPPEIWVTSIAGPVTPGEAAQAKLVAATALGLPRRPADVVAVDPAAPSALETLYQHPAAVWQIAASPDGKTIASVDYKGNLFIHDVMTGQTKQHSGRLERWCQALLLSPDGGSLIAGNEAGKIIVVDLNSGDVTKTIVLDQHAVTSLAVSPSGDQIAATDGGGHVHLLSWPGLDEVTKIDVAGEAAWCVAYDPAGESLLVGCGDRKLYRTATKADAKPAEVLTATDWLTKIAVSPAGEVAVGEIGGAIHLFAMPTTDDAISPTTINAPSGVWAIHWRDAGTLMIGTRKHGVQVATRSWKWAGE